MWSKLLARRDGFIWAVIRLTLPHSRRSALSLRNNNPNDHERQFEKGNHTDLSCLQTWVQVSALASDKSRAAWQATLLPRVLTRGLSCTAMRHGRVTGTIDGKGIEHNEMLAKRSKLANSWMVYALLCVVR